ncbi:MAG: hypothetical protein O7H41_18060 [Planctomycetota bacterium]|nr:hypothetical protein [Planctomycetota bacterium]
MVRMKIGSALLLGLLVLGCGKDDHDRKGPAGPRIVRAVPDNGYHLGGNTVVVETLGFQDDFTIDAPLLYIGGIGATNTTALSSGWILAETPAAVRTGPVDVRVESTGVPETGILRDGFTYAYRTVELFGRTIPLPSDSVVYVLNRSADMDDTVTFVTPQGTTVTGTRWDQIKYEMLSSFESLPETVDFNVVTFACNRDAFIALGVVPATSTNKSAALAWINGHFPWGGAGTGPGVEDALIRDSGTLTFLLVDTGSPNCGATGYVGHTAIILAANVQRAAIHTFGIDVAGLDRDFLENIAMQTGGTYTDVVP